jgi:hypothetical protein
MSPAPMRFPPIQITETLEMLMISITVGNVAAIRRPARSAVAVSSSLACAKRAVSWGSRTNARTTRMPVICSRSTWLTRSIRSCIAWNDGIIRYTIEPSASTAPGMANSRITERPRSSRTAKKMPMTRLSGAVIIIVTAITTSIWICWTSLVVRVISDGAPNWPISRAENPVTVWNRSRRTSRPNPIAACAAYQTAPIENTICTSVKPSITAPMLRM